MSLQLMCPIGYTGYGYASLNILKELYVKDNNTSLHPIGNPSIDNQKDLTIVKSCIDNTIKNNYLSTSIKIWHQFDLLTHIGAGEYFAFPFFEIDTFSELEKYHLNFPDMILVSCNWAKEVLINNGINSQIEVVPLGVDSSIFFPKTIPNKKDTYVFCTIGKWEKRKNHDLIIECFNKAFDQNDDVELWMITHNSFLSKEEEQEWVNLVVKSKLKDKIKIFPRLPSHSDIAEAISYSDCGIYISRGEGWNMELLESMAMNKPVIASNYSAHTEYCNRLNSFMVDIDEKEVANDNKWFMGQGNWAKFSNKQIEQTIEYMRHVYKSKIKTNPEGLKTAEQYSWSNTANRILSLV
jgi:glycosyltransferase involved in cell wall biosynthesis